MKRILIVVIIIIVLVIAGFFSPWLNWNLSLSNLIGFGPKKSVAGLKVFSLLGELEVYMDNTYQGRANPEEGALEVTDISIGTHEILIKRADKEDNYFILKEAVKFEEGVDVVVSYDLGPNDKFSEGHIFYAEKSFSTDQTKLNLISSPDKAKVFIDDRLIGETPISGVDLDITSTRKIKLQKDNYDEIEFNILPDNQEERDKLKGYTLNLEVRMFLIPIQIQRN